MSEERARWASQTERVLARLAQGPASNAELAAISLKYTSRISDARALGYVIEAYHHNRETGQCWYRLVTPETPRVRTETVPRVEVPVPKGRLF